MKCFIIIVFLVISLIELFTFILFTEIYPTLITIGINRGGVFTTIPGRRYINGKHDFVDLVNTDELSVHDFDAMMKELRYNEKERMHYHFLIPNSELDFGLQVLRNDQDILNLLNYVPKIKLIDVFVEHGKPLLEWVDSKTDVYVPVEENHLQVVERMDDFNRFDDFDPFVGLETNLPKVDKGKGVDVNQGSGIKHDADDIDDDTEDSNYLVNEGNKLNELDEDNEGNK